VHERPDVDPGDGGEARSTALLGALDDDVEDGRSRDEQEGERGEAEDPYGAGIGKDHG